MSCSQTLLSLRHTTRAIAYRCFPSLWNDSEHEAHHSVSLNFAVRRNSSYNRGNYRNKIHDRDNTERNSNYNDDSYNMGGTTQHRVSRNRHRRDNRSSDSYDRSLNTNHVSENARNRERRRDRQQNFDARTTDERVRMSIDISDVLQPLKNTSLQQIIDANPYYNRWHKKYHEKRELENKPDLESDAKNYVRDQPSGQYMFKPELGKNMTYDERKGRYVKIQNHMSLVPKGVPLQSFGISDVDDDHNKARYFAKNADLLGEKHAQLLEITAKKRGLEVDDAQPSKDEDPEKDPDEHPEFDGDEHVDRFFVEDTNKLNKVKESSEAIQFSKVGVKSYLTELLCKNNIVKPTAVQAHAIPKILQGKSVIMESETGSGKTLAYLLPLLQNVQTNSKCWHIIVVPTRELATQVYTEVLKYGIEEEHVSRLVSGVDNEEATELVLSNSSILVGTPKKLLKIIDETPNSFKQVKTIVMDEVDKLFINRNWTNRGQSKKSKDKNGKKIFFQAKQKLEKTKPTELLVSLLQYLKEGRKSIQLIGTSATVPDYFIEDLKTWVFPPNTALIDLIPQTHSRGMVPSNIQIHHLKLNKAVGKETAPTMAQLFKTLDETSVIVVVGKERSVDGAVLELQQQGLEVRALYKELGLNGAQVNPEFLQQFESGEIQAVVVSELQIRGFDFPFVNSMYVTCFTEVNDFVHLAGRVGRRGQPARVITLIPADKYTNRAARYRYFLGKINCSSTGLNKLFNRKNAKWLNQIAMEKRTDKICVETIQSSNLNL